MKKQLIYLDQSYVSTMAKQLAGQVRPGQAELGKTLGELHSLLARLVAKNKVLCPRSSVHDQETDLFRQANDVLSERIHDVITELSDGKKFLSYGDIELQQAIRALGRYLDLQVEPEDGRWQHAFYDNPHLAIRSPRIYVRMPWADAFAEDDQKRKDRIQDFRASLQETRAANPLPFKDVLEGQFLGVAKHRYGLPIQQYLRTLLAVETGAGARLLEDASDLDALDYLNMVTPPLAMRLVQAYARFTNTNSPVGDERFWRFFSSPEFRSVPYYNIFCSMEAGFISYKPERKPRPSDPYDFAALASVLPYVDVMTTDSAINDMVVQLGLDVRYGVEVFSARKADVEALLKRLSGLD